jgi:hypothetical protein
MLERYQSLEVKEVSSSWLYATRSKKFTDKDTPHLVYSKMADTTTFGIRSSVYKRFLETLGDNEHYQCTS